MAATAVGPSLVDQVRALVARRAVFVAEIEERTAAMQRIDDELASVRVALEELSPLAETPLPVADARPSAPDPTAEDPVLAMIRTRGALKFNDLTRTLSMTRARLREHLSRLKTAGQIRVTGHTSGARYHLATPPANSLDAPVEKRCDLCRNPFPQRSNRQRICVDCRLKHPNRSVEELREGPRSLPKGWREMPCEGRCGKTIQTNGVKKRCPDCQLQAKRDRFVKQVEGKKHADRSSEALVDRIVDAPAPRRLETPPLKVDVAVIEARDAAVLESLRRLGGVAMMKDLRARFPKTDPAAADPAELDDALRSALTRLKAKGLVGRTADTWSLVGAAEVAAHV